MIEHPCPFYIQMPSLLAQALSQNYLIKGTYFLEEGTYLPTLFTQLPRRLILGNRASGMGSYRKPLYTPVVAYVLGAGLSAWRRT
jgi:hypothetical protein